MLEIRFHPGVYSDVDSIMGYYERVASTALADDFYAELMASVRAAARSPGIYAIRSGDLRRVNLARFPYHFLFRVCDNTARILIVRHHARHPSFGLDRS